jgi:hypothetical protein
VIVQLHRQRLIVIGPAVDGVTVAWRFDYRRSSCCAEIVCRGRRGVQRFKLHLVELISHGIEPTATPITKPLFIVFVD